MSNFVRDVPDGCVLSVRVHPGARRNAVIGVHADALKISLTTPPVDGRANEALIAFLAEALQLSKARISLLSGTTSRSKVVRIAGKSAAEIEVALGGTVDC